MACWVGRGSLLPDHDPWTSNLHGHLVDQGVHTTATHDSFHRSTYECVDVNAEGIPGSETNHNGATLYFTEARCGSLSCPPYVDGDEMPCVV